MNIDPERYFASISTLTPMGIIDRIVRILITEPLRLVGKVIGYEFNMFPQTLDVIRRRVIVPSLHRDYERFIGERF